MSGAMRSMANSPKGHLLVLFILSAFNMSVFARIFGIFAQNFRISAKIFRIIAQIVRIFAKILYFHCTAISYIN